VGVLNNFDRQQSFERPFSEIRFFLAQKVDSSRNFGVNLGKFLGKQI